MILLRGSFIMDREDPRDDVECEDLVEALSQALMDLAKRHGLSWQPETD